MFLFDGHAVQEGLERGACLTQRCHAIHIGRVGQFAAAAHVSQHVAVAVVDNNDGAILDIALVQREQVFVQRTHGVPLQVGIQRGGDARAGLLQQVLCEVRRDAVARDVLVASIQCLAGELVQFVAARIVRVLRHLEQCAGAIGYLLRFGHRPFQQGHQQQRLRTVQSRGMDAEQGGRGGVDAVDLAAERGEVEIGFEYLLLAPALFDLARGGDLLQLLRRACAWSIAGASVGSRKPGQLHGQRRGAARAFAIEEVPQVGAARGNQRQPIHAAVLVEAFVFRQQQQVLRGGRDVVQACPFQAAHFGVDAFDGDDFAVAVEQPGFRGLVFGFGFGEGGDGVVGRKQGAGG